MDPIPWMITVAWCDHIGAYVARVAALALHAIGGTPQEAVLELVLAIEERRGYTRAATSCV
jgi:hypothetical protein